MDAKRSVNSPVRLCDFEGRTPVGRFDANRNNSRKTNIPGALDGCRAVWIVIFGVEMSVSIDERWVLGCGFVTSHKALSNGRAGTPEVRGVVRTW